MGQFWILVTRKCLLLQTHCCWCAQTWPALTRTLSRGEGGESRRLVNGLRNQKAPADSSDVPRSNSDDGSRFGSASYSEASRPRVVVRVALLTSLARCSFQSYPSAKRWSFAIDKVLATLAYLRSVSTTAVVVELKCAAMTPSEPPLFPIERLLRGLLTAVHGPSWSAGYPVNRWLELRGIASCGLHGEEV